MCAHNDYQKVLRVMNSAVFGRRRAESFQYRWCRCGRTRNALFAAHVERLTSPSAPPNRPPKSESNNSPNPVPHVGLSLPRVVSNLYSLRCDKPAPTFRFVEGDCAEQVGLTSGRFDGREGGRRRQLWRTSTLQAGRQTPILPRWTSHRAVHGPSAKSIDPAHLQATGPATSCAGRDCGGRAMWDGLCWAVAVGRRRI